MPALKYKGLAAAASQDVVDYAYVASLLPSGLSTGAVDTRINSNLSGKVLKSYVDAQDLLNANQAYVDAGDASRIKIADKDVVNGVLGLGPTGRAAAVRFNVASTQRWASGIWTPSTYGVASAVSAESTVYSMAIADPGFAYKIVCFGTVDASTSVDGQYPVVWVRDGSTAGTVIGEGRGGADSYLYTTGMTGGDNFERTDEDGIGTDLWQSQYQAGNNSRGYDAIINSHEAQWIDVGGQSTFVFHRRIKAADALTNTDDQMITLTAGSIVAETTPTFDPDDASTMVACRMSTDMANFVYFGLLSVTSNHKLVWGYRKAGTFSAPSVTQVNITQGAGDVWSLQAVGRVFTAYKNDVAVSTFNDSTNVTNMGASYRGWGWGHQAAARSFNSAQTTPGSVADIKIQDNPTLTATAPVNVVPINYAAQSVKTGATTLYVRINRSGGSGTVSATNFQPHLVAYAVPA